MPDVPSPVAPAPPAPPVPAASPPPGRSVGLSELFLGFFKVGVSGFGGVLPWARRMIVEDRRWMTEVEFTEVLGLGQFLPGPNIVNCSVIIGARFRGRLGAIAAFSGLMLAPFAITAALGILYTRYGQVPLVRHAFAGVTAAASGLIVAAAIKMAKPLMRKPRAVVFGVVAFAAIALLRWPLLEVLVVLAPLSILVHWPRIGSTTRRGP